MTEVGARWSVRPIEPSDRDWLREVLAPRWGGPWQAYGGELVDAARADGLLACDAASVRAGFLLHRPVAVGWEIVLLDAFQPGRGIGTALVGACETAARAAGASRLAVMTTNDNLRALRFYQRRGFKLVALRPGAVDAARCELKASIPETGEHGILICDEIVLNLGLA